MPTSSLHALTATQPNNCAGTQPQAPQYERLAISSSVTSFWVVVSRFFMRWFSFQGFKFDLGLVDLRQATHVAQMALCEMPRGASYIFCSLSRREQRQKLPSRATKQLAASSLACVETRVL